MTRIYLVRHGETDYNIKGCYYGWTDCSLTENGVQQAKVLADKFKAIEIDAILTSDLNRALETAKIIGAENEPIVDNRLRELNFGKWEGKSYEEIIAEHQDSWNMWIADPLNAKPTDGESAAEMYSRICLCLDEALTKYNDRNILIVAHNGSLRMIMTCFLGLALDMQWCFSFEQGRYSMLELNEGHCTIRYINNI